MPPVPDDAIVPDDKDWTWVLERPCPECGLDAGSVPPTVVGSMVRDNAAAWEQLLRRPDDELRRRPAPGRWAPLEYACHVRDVCSLYLERLVLMLNEDDPLYPNWDQDATALEARYREQDPATVSAELAAAAGALADAFDALGAAQWQRPGRRGDGATFTVATFSRYMVHDPVHHLWDVTGRRAG